MMGAQGYLQTDEGFYCFACKRTRKDPSNMVCNQKECPLREKRGILDPEKMDVKK